MAKRSLGHYDAAHNTIVVSRVFDRPSSPRYAIEYLLYHEMLHLKHPVKMRGLRRCVHSREFKAEEALFPQLTKPSPSSSASNVVETYACAVILSNPERSEGALEGSAVAVRTVWARLHTWPINTRYHS